MEWHNQPITRREYKLMLKTEMFKERDKGISRFIGVIKDLIFEMRNSESNNSNLFFDEIMEKLERI